MRRFTPGVDLSVRWARTGGVRNLLVALAVAAIAILSTARVAGDDRTVSRASVPAAARSADGDRIARRVSVPAHLSIRVPADWHVLRGWLSDVVDPAPRLAVASFPARLSRHTCECGFPNVIDFPRDGAFTFVWEYPAPSARGLARTPRRPVGFHLAAGRRARQTCDGSSRTFDFKDAGRVFRVEVYLGPRAGPAVRRRVAATLDNLRVTAGV